MAPLHVFHSGHRLEQFLAHEGFAGRRSRQKHPDLPWLKSLHEILQRPALRPIVEVGRDHLEVRPTDVAADDVVQKIGERLDPGIKMRVNAAFSGLVRSLLDCLQEIQDAVEGRMVCFFRSRRLKLPQEGNHVVF